MTLPTKILLAIVVVVAGSAMAYADVTANDAEAVNFTPASRGPASLEPSDTQEALTVREEVADDQTECGTCQDKCHPPFNYSAKTALPRFDLSKIN